MTRLDSQTISVWIQRDPRQVYDYVLTPENLPLWASGLGRFEGRDGDGALFSTPTGRARVTFAARNPLGVLDHVVTLESGAEVFVPLRVLPNGSGSEVFLTLFRQPEMSDAQYAQDRAWVEKDLATLKARLEEP